MPTPATVVHVDSESGFSGGQVQVFLLMEGLRERHGVRSILYGVPGGRPFEEATSRGFEARTFPMRNDLDLPAVLRASSLLRADRPDLVHLHTGRANWLGGWAAKRVGIPAVTTRRMDRKLRRGLATKLTYDKLVRHAAAISPAVERRLHAAGVPPSLTSVIWSSVDAHALQPERPRATVRAELGLADDELLIFAAARLTRRKGFDLALAALDELPEDPTRPPWRFLLAGDGEALTELGQQATALALDKRVRFLGQRDDLPDLLGAADLFLMPSRQEGLGVGALEAMASGTAVLATSVGGLGEAVVHDKSGWLVAPEDVGALARALQQLLTDASLRTRLAAGGQQRVADTFSPDTMVDAYAELYARVLAWPAG